MRAVRLPAFLSRQDLFKRYNPDLGMLNKLVQGARNACDIYSLQTRVGKKRTITSKEVGDKLEEAVHYLFSCTSDIFVPNGSLSTDTSQLDNNVEVRVRQGFLDRWPPYILVECKNWSGKVGKPEVCDFIKKIEDSNCHVGILFARKGITGSEYKDAEGKLTLAANRGFVVIVLTDNHLDKLCNGRNFIEMLETEYRNRVLSPA